MPVVVTGADTPLGRLLLDRLVGAGLDLRATVEARADVQQLVDRGVKTAVSDLVDTERFGAVVENAHTVIHLRGSGSGGGAGEVLRGVPDVLAALPESGVERVVTITGFGLEAHPSLELLRGSGLDVVVLRVGVVLAPLQDPRAQRPRVLPPTRLIAPLYVDDLVGALVAADRLRAITGYVELDAVGPDVITAGGLDALLGTRRGILERWSDRGPQTRLAAYRRSSHVDVPMVGDRGEALGRLLGVHPMALTDVIAAVRSSQAPARRREMGSKDKGGKETKKPKKAAK
ncbi:MAG: NAD(P)H-binding protein [Pseudonocardiales bacterium]